MALVEKWLVEPFAKGLLEPYTLTAILNNGIKTMFYYSSNRNSELGLFGMQQSQRHSVFITWSCESCLKHLPRTLVGEVS